MSEASKNSEAEHLRKGVMELFKHIQKMKKELALMRKPDDTFCQMTDELDAVVEATEQATDNIMENSETIDDIVCKLKARIKDPEDIKDLNKISENSANIIVACSFQDITGQRVTKVLRSIQFIEERINSLISAWGENEISKMQVDAPEETDEFKKYLNGPQLKGKGVSQQDVDAMLSGTKTPQKASVSAPPQTPKPTVAKPQNPAPKPENSNGSGFNQSDIDSLFD